MRKKMAITIKSKPNLIVPKRVQHAADDTLTPAEAKKVRLRMKQIKEGKFRLWSEIKQELNR